MEMMARFGSGVRAIEISAPKARPSKINKGIDQSQRRNNLLIDTSLDIIIFPPDSYPA